MSVVQRVIAVICAAFAIAIAAWFVLDQAPRESLRVRLDREKPVHQGEVKFVEFQLGDVAVTQTIAPVRLRSGETLRVHGMLDDGEWGLSGVKIVAKSDAAGGRGIKPGDKRLMLSMELYDNSVDLQPVDWPIVYTSHLRRELEFEAEIIAPQDPGEYVADLMLYDETPAPRGEKNERRGFPIARIPLQVHE